MPAKNLPLAPSRSKPGADSVGAELWLRINAFLQLKSPRTQVTYKGIIEEWCRFLRVQPGSADSVKALTAARDLHVMAFRTWLEKQPGEIPRAKRTAGARSRNLSTKVNRAEKKSGLESTLSNATIAKKFAALRRVYRLLIAAGLVSGENPFDSDIVPPPPKDAGRKRPTEMIPFRKVMQIVNSADPRSPKGLRDKAILAALFGGALRRSEAATLRLGDFRKSPSGTYYLYLRSTKAKKDAEQALPKWAAQIILELASARKKDGAAETDRLFVSYTGQGGKTATNSPISDTGIYKLFKHYCALAGAGDFVSPHSARATAITKLLEDGLSHREVKEFSRHASVQMVEVYDKRRIGVDQNPAKDLDYD